MKLSISKGISRGTVLYVLLLIAMSFSTSVFAAKPGDWPVHAQARQALVDGNLTEAKMLFEIAVLADPNNRLTWYNFACALALSGDNDEAVVALDNACETGYWDHEWMVQDPDLVELYERDDFLQVVDKMKVKQAEDEADKAAHPTYYLPQTMMGHYNLTFPDDYDPESGKKYTLVLLLHGRGEGCQGIHRLPDKLTVKDAIYAQAFAPYPLAGNRLTWEYWPRQMYEQQNYEDINKAIKFTTDWHRDLIKDVSTKVNVDNKNIFVVGFSMGAGMTYATACDNADLFAGAAVLSGGIYDQYKDGKLLTRIARRKMPVFIGHGTQDNVEYAEEGRDMLKSAGVDVTMKTYNVGHSMPDEEMADLTEWIESHKR